MNSQIKRVLEFYANPDNYNTLQLRTTYGKNERPKWRTGHPPVVDDRGERARYALRMLK